jgi:flagellar biogenesis protein FliO
MSSEIATVPVLILILCCIAVLLSARFRMRRVQNRINAPTAQLKFVEELQVADRVTVHLYEVKGVRLVALLSAQGVALCELDAKPDSRGTEERV